MTTSPPIPAPLSDTEIARLLQKKSAWKQADVIRSTLIAIVSTIVLFGGMILFIQRTEGWEAVQQAFFSPPDFKEAWPKVVDGFWLNVKMFLIAEPIILAFGLLLAVLRLTKNPVLFPLRAFAIGYIDLFRGIPFIIVLFLVGFGVPTILDTRIPPASTGPTTSTANPWRPPSRRRVSTSPLRPRPNPWS